MQVKSLPLIFCCLVLLLSGCGSRNSGRGRKEARITPVLEKKVEILDRMLAENSGLLYHDGKLWTINDSGGDPVLFALDAGNGKALQAIQLENAENADWESLAQDEGHFYICDVGNNYGRRNVLRIYILQKDSVPVSGNVSLRPDMIEFRYAGREEDNNPLRRSPYDCEAVFAYGDSLYIFTKDWVRYSTTLYTCPVRPGSYAIKARRTYPVDGLVTGADYNPADKVLVLCGYRDYVPLVWILRDFNPLDYSFAEMFRLDFPAHRNLQTEGIAIVSPARVILSCETSERPAGLYSLDLGSYLKK